MSLITNLRVQSKPQTLVDVYDNPNVSMIYHQDKFLISVVLFFKKPNT